MVATNASLCAGPAVYGGPTFNLSRAWRAPPDVPPRVLANLLPYVTRKGARLGFVPTLTQSLFHRTFARNLLPGSTTRGEDAMVMASFFADEHARYAPPRSAHAPFFLEAGAYDGLYESTTLYLERCLGWNGLLIEAQPMLYGKVVRNRPNVSKVHTALCADTRLVNFSAKAATFSRRAEHAADGWGSGLMVEVPCEPLTGLLERMRVRRVDFLSLDVEGAETDVVSTLTRAFASRSLSVGVLMIEVRGDGQRSKLVPLLLKSGMVYVGQFHGRATMTNEIIDDLWYSPDHMRRHFPASRVGAYERQIWEAEGGNSARRSADREPERSSRCGSVQESWSDPACNDPVVNKLKPAWASL